MTCLPQFEWGFSIENQRLVIRNWYTTEIIDDIYVNMQSHRINRSFITKFKFLHKVNETWNNRSKHHFKEKLKAPLQKIQEEIKENRFKKGEYANFR